jgi:hypothetical protein
LPSLPIPGAKWIIEIISIHRDYKDNLYSQGLSSLPSPGAERDYRGYRVIGVIGIIPNQSGRKEFKRVFVDPGGKKA